jgi:hypothetical protein
MPFPKIRHCLVCEDIRIERGHKAIILGFYGIAPDVDIGILDFSKPMDRLMFLLTAERGATGGEYKVLLQILDESDCELQKSGQSGPIDVVVAADPAATNSFGFGAVGLHLPKPGRYTLRMSVNGEKHYENTFNVQQGKKEDL